MPNLACMKISGFHKQMGDQIHLLTEYSGFNEFDKVYLSKVFTATRYPPEVLKMENVEYGGTGFYLDQAPELPYEIEHAMPDYSLYARIGLKVREKKEKRVRSISIIGIILLGF